MTVEVWIWEGNIQIDPEGHPDGGPCLSIPASRDVVWAWCRELMNAVENGEADVELPGDFLTIDAKNTP